MNKRVVMAMSGGIDSAVGALILKEKGYHVTGVFMRNWDNSDEKASIEACNIDKDENDMYNICKILDIEAHSVNFSKEYWNNVFIPFLEAYETGLLTPNPDVYCNRNVKFYQLQSYISKTFNIQQMATGHYSRISFFNEFYNDNNNNNNNNNNNKVYGLQRGSDLSKDQSYFLSLTPSSFLSNTLFPLGTLTKQEVKSIFSSHHNLSTNTNILSKKESMGICFIGKRKMNDFLNNYIDLTSGRFIDIDTGKIIGRL